LHDIGAATAMSWMMVIKFLHLICGVSFFGITIAAFYYIARSIQKKESSMILYSIKASYFGDVIILVCVVIQLITSTSLVAVGHFTLQVPWIFVAYHAYALLILLWLMDVVLKKFYLTKPIISPAAIKSFYVMNTVMILIFMLIIHDAVMHATWLEPFFRN
jgi:uncharacterized membrane protein